MRTAVAAFASGILNAESAGAAVYFWMIPRDHEVASLVMPNHRTVHMSKLNY